MPIIYNFPVHYMQSMFPFNLIQSQTGTLPSMHLLFCFWGINTLCSACSNTRHLQSNGKYLLRVSMENIHRGFLLQMSCEGQSLYSQFGCFNWIALIQNHCIIGIKVEKLNAQTNWEQWIKNLTKCPNWTEPNWIDLSATPY